MEFRHEYKHYLNYSDYLALQMRLNAVMKLDSHANRNNEYRIRSLYFDNYNDKALREKLEGVNKREKFRIRCYNDNYDYISLEKKSKINGLSKKQSVNLTQEETKRIIAHDIEWMRIDLRPLVVELYAKIKSQLLKPSTVVDYIRQPYVYSAGNVRVTIDRDIRTGLKSTDFFNPNLPTVSTGETILLEVKYDGFLPDAIRAAVQLDGRRGTSFSKYAACRMYG